MSNNNSMFTKIEYYDNYQFKNKSALNLKNPFGNIFNPSPLSPSNISYYQSPQITSDFLNQSSLKNENERLESLNELIYSNNYPEEPETPKMSFNFENNKEPSEKFEKEDEINNNNVQNQSTKDQTKNVISKELKTENDIKIIPIIQNIVSTVNLGNVKEKEKEKLNLNLKLIALQVENTQYNPSKFTGLVIRIKEPRTTALIFPNGKLVCLGAKTEEDSLKACKQYAKIIKNLNYPISTVNNFRVQNIVGSSNVNFKIPLMKLYIHMKKYNCKVIYEPECFPGLIYRYLDEEEKNEENKDQKLNIVFLIFASGKMVITGAKKRKQIYDSFEKVFHLLIQFKNKLDQN